MWMRWRGWQIAVYIGEALAGVALLALLVEGRWHGAIILAIVVLGGMGSQIGVAIAAIAMIGGTEIMRDMNFLKDIFGNTFDPTQYRMLIFGFAMVLIMIWRPRGLISTREPSVFLKERKKIGADLIGQGHG